MYRINIQKKYFRPQKFDFIVFKHLSQTWLKINGKWYTDKALFRLYKFISGWLFMPPGCPIVDSVCKTELENIRDEYSGRGNFDKYIVYLYDTYFGTKPRYNREKWMNYYKDVLHSPYFILDSNSIESLNKKLKITIPDGMLQWKKLTKVLKNFHSVEQNKVYFEKYRKNRLKPQCKQTRERMKEYRRLIQEYSDLDESERKSETLKYIYLLGTVTNPTLSEKFLSQPVIELDNDEISNTDNLHDYTGVCGNETEIPDNTYLPSFLCPNMPELEN